MKLALSEVTHVGGYPTAWLIVLLILPVLIAWRVAKATFDSLRHVPGPFLARFTRLWYLKHVFYGKFEKINIELHKKYGPIVRIAPNEYSISDPSAIKTIYGHGTHFVKAPWYRASGHPDPDRKNLFTEENPKLHSENRKKVASLYSLSSLVQYEPYVADSIQVLLTRFEEMARSKEVVDVRHWLQCMAFDAIAQLTFARRFGFLDRGEDPTNLFGAIHQYLWYCANVGVIHEWHPFLFRIMPYIPGLAGTDYISKFGGEQLQEKMRETEKGGKNDAGRGDFLTRLWNMHKKDPDKITQNDLMVMCFTNIGAGSDTTSISLAAILYHVYKDRTCLEKLRHEIDAAVAEFQPPSGTIRFADAQQLSYLQACIKEGLRIHPVTGLPLARVVPKEGTTISGCRFPAGAVVGVNAWIANSNAEVFGADADVFRPERWLEDAEAATVMDRNLLSFGAGSRTCIGKNISILEISKLVPEIVRRFDLELAEPDKELETENVWFVKQKNFFCRIRHRASAGSSEVVVQ